MQCLVALALVAASADARNNKNILFLLEDDGSMDSSPYGNSLISTPNIAALAARGTVFDSFHTTVSSCSPSRASILSGLPTHNSGQYGLQHGQEHFSSFEQVVSAPNLLTAAGYATGIIGKYHVAPAASYNFTWGNSPGGPGGCQTGASVTCPSTDYNFVSRNITNMKEAASSFLDYAATLGAAWMLYVGFGDSHRCGGAVGEFCELYGVDSNGRSTIPDWTPHTYDPANVSVPFWIQDTPAARVDISHMWTAKSRMDQGVGLLLALLHQRGLTEETLVVYTADNGAPFARGKTNLYEVGSMEPLVVSMPGAAGGVRSPQLTSTLDLFPTFLDWAGVPLPTDYSILGARVNFTGRSLLPYVGNGPVDEEVLAGRPSSRPHRGISSYACLAAAAQGRAAAVAGGAAPLSLPSTYSSVHGSFQMHEVQEYYPMRSVTATAPNGAHYRLIYNLASRLTYPFAQDLWAAPATQDLLTRYASGQPTEWYFSVPAYFNDTRAKYELYDLVADPMELTNVAQVGAYGDVFATLAADIKSWQYATNDDWTVKYSHE